MRSIALLTVIAAAAVMCGCATITRGTSQSFVVESDPAGADVTFREAIETDKSGNPKKAQQVFQPSTCKTPCAIKAKRKPGFTVTISKEGYETIEATVSSGVSGAGGAGMAGNVLLGGLIGAAIDGSSGAMNELSPNPLKVTLEKKVSPVAALQGLSTEQVREQLVTTLEGNTGSSSAVSPPSNQPTVE